jgi:hypothetical protein
VKVGLESPTYGKLRHIKASVPASLPRRFFAQLIGSAIENEKLRRSDFPFPATRDQARPFDLL